MRGSATHLYRKNLLFSQNQLLQYIGQEAAGQGYRAYVVGGMVRDVFLQNESNFVPALEIEADVDIVLACTEVTRNVTGNFAGRDAIDFAHFLQRTYGGQITVHERFRTATWLLDQDALAAQLRTDELPINIDLITARQERYAEPADLPIVQPSRIEDDLARRDFTINTMAVCLHPAQWNQLFDLHNGVNDLQAGLVRVLHDQSFVDDPTRIFRAVRYEQRFGFQIEAKTLGCLQAALETGMLDRLTPARVRHEFERIFHEREPERSLQRLADLGVLVAIHPHLEMDGQSTQAFVQIRNGSQQATFQEVLAALPPTSLYWSIWTYRLDPTTRAELQELLRWPKDIVQLSQGLAEFSQKLAQLRLPDLHPSQVVALLEKMDHRVWSMAALLWENERLVLERLTCYASKWRHVRSQLRGGDLHALNVPRGPMYAQILRGLRDARLDGEIESREDEIAWVYSFLATDDSTTS